MAERPFDLPGGAALVGDPTLAALASESHTIGQKTLPECLATCPGGCTLTALPRDACHAACENERTFHGRDHERTDHQPRVPSRGARPRAEVRHVPVQH